MKKISLLIFALASFALMGYRVNLVAASEDYEIFGSSPQKVFFPGWTTLEPGMATSCKNDFIVENMGGSEADLKIILGKEWKEVKVMGMESKAYGLQGKGHLEGNDVTTSDMAVIINNDKHSSVRLHCVE